MCRVVSGLRKNHVYIALVATIVFAASIGQSLLRMQASLKDGQPSGVISERAELVAVTFSSKWCGPCKILKPRLAAIKPDFAGKAVRFIDLSFTFGEQAEFYEIAKAEGFSEVYEHYNAATGFTVLVDRDHGKVLGILTMDHSKDMMRDVISRALVVASS